MNKRTSCPSSTEKAYMQANYGGYNKCILGNSNPTRGSGYKRTGYSVLPNCCGYVHGRWIELGGYNHDIDGLSLGNAKTYYPNWKGNKGQTPKVGAIMCWTNNSAGHVAVVEQVIDSDTVLTSESNWNGPKFSNRTRHRAWGNGNWSYWQGTDIYFQGFIYPPFTVESTNDVNINVGGTTTDVSNETFKGTFTADTALNIRSECTTNSTVLACMKKGEECTCLGQAKLIPNDGGRGWMKVTYKGITGFAYSRYLTKKNISITTSTDSNIKVGSIIRIKNGATSYSGGSFGSATYTNKYTVASVSGNKVGFLSRSGSMNYVSKANCTLIKNFTVGTSFKIIKCSGTSNFGSATFSNTYSVASISGSTVKFKSKSGATNSINVKYCYAV